MVSGGAEGADRAWANAATKLGIPVFNFTFNRHLSQAMLNKGLPRKLNEAELEELGLEELDPELMLPLFTTELLTDCVPLLAVNITLIAVMEPTNLTTKFTFN